MNACFARINGYEPILFDVVDRAAGVAFVIQRFAVETESVVSNSVTVCERSDDFCLCVDTVDGDHMVIDVGSQYCCPVVTRLIEAGIRIDFI